MSRVLIPASIVFRTASSMALASFGKLNEYWSIMAVERIAATGLTFSWPAISGAEPVEDSQHKHSFSGWYMPYRV